MRYFEMGLAFAALGFVVANAVISLLTGLLWRGTRRSRHGAGWLFGLRMAPAVGSASLVLSVIVPAFVSFEPRATTERAGPALLGFMVVAGILVAAGWHRAFVSWRETRRLERMWRAVGVRSVYPGMPVPAYRVPSNMPLAALVGVVRPRLFVSDTFLDALSADERQAVLGHEAGHLRALDNLKRTLMKLAPDWLSFSSAGREIEAAWAIAAEEAADDVAAGPDRARTLDLGSALLKASRLTPTPPAFASSFSDGAPIARRVERLLNEPPPVPGPVSTKVPRFAWMLAALAAAEFSAAPVLRTAYTMTEAAVQMLR